MSRQFSNHTPIDFDNLLNKYQKRIATIGKNVSGSRMSSNIPNIFLVIGVVAFVGAFTFSINQTQTSTNTRASATNGPKAPKQMYIANAASPLRTLTQYPKTYKGTAIPQTIFSEGEKKYTELPDKKMVKTYIIDQVGKYYVYMDLLGEKNLLTETPTQNPTFDIIEKKVPEMEKIARSELVDNIDFTYIKAWSVLDFNNHKTEIQSKFAGQNKEKAEEIITQYQNDLKNGESIESVIVRANQNTDLDLLNNNELNQDVQNYIRDDNLIRNRMNLKVTDNNFHNFLFGQNTNEVSEIYEVGDENKKYMYMIVYPSQIKQGEYKSLLELFQQKSSLFSS